MKHISRSQTNVRHGHGRRKGRPGSYVSWAQMRSRCSNPNVPEYAHYGARGIKVCERWNSYEAFLTDMGERPARHSIDRIDVNGDYEPSNCRWANRETQASNTTKSALVTIDGETATIAQWVRRLGRNSSTVRVRIHRGLSPEEALLKP